MRKLGLPIVLAAGALCCAGCWPWHRGPTPQQQFFNAISRGNGAQATQIWLHMSGGERAALVRGEGVKPQISQQAAAQKIMRHEAEQMGASLEPGGETAEVPEPAPAGLEELPKYLGARNGGSPPASVPTY
ncbi:MAG: hypothetical protein ACREQI_03055 [Candidatus Binataceae bacterium]